jgi:hypothetical protein
MKVARAGVLAWLLVLSLAAMSPIAVAAPVPTAAEIAARLQERFHQMQDYQCVMRSETRAGTKADALTLRIWYRRPGLLRLRVLRGRHRGSELLLGGDGVLHGRRGGLLRPFSERLDRSDPSLRSLRGLPAWEVDFGSFLHSMEQRISQPDSSKAVHEAAGPTLVVEVEYDAIQTDTRDGAHSQPDSSASSAPLHHTRLRDVWTVNPKDWLLVSGDVYDGTERVDHFEFSEVQVDTGLKESWFRF